jgi:hypothetical protein
MTNLPGYTLMATAQRGAMSVFFSDDSWDIAVCECGEWLRSDDSDFPRFVVDREEMTDLQTGERYTLTFLEQ